MADITSRLKAVKEGIRKLANLAGSEQAEAARQLAVRLSADLDSAAAEAAARPGAEVSPRPEPPRAPKHEVERCPICSLRGFTFQKGTVRACADADSGFEAYYRCMSCAHEGWRELA